MADTKISALDTEASPTDADMIPIVDNETLATKKVLYSTIKANMLTFVAPSLSSSLTKYLLPARYHVFPIGTPTLTTSIATNTLYAIPFILAQSRTVTKVAIHVTTASTNSKCRLGCYTDTGNIYPGTLITNGDAGEVALTPIGVREINPIVGSWTLTNGTLYWLAILAYVTGTTPVLVGTSGGWQPLGFNPTAASSSFNAVGGGMYVVTRTYGVLPTTFPASAVPNSGTQNPFRIGVYFT